MNRPSRVIRFLSRDKIQICDVHAHAGPRKCIYDRDFHRTIARSARWSVLDLSSLPLCVASLFICKRINHCHAWSPFLFYVTSQVDFCDCTLPHSVRHINATANLLKFSLRFPYHILHDISFELNFYNFLLFVIWYMTNIIDSLWGNTWKFISEIYKFIPVI